MLVEQFLEGIQKLIDRGTINPTAEIGVQGEVYTYEEDYFVSIDSEDLEIGIRESSYNKLILVLE